MRIDGVNNRDFNNVPVTEDLEEDLDHVTESTVDLPVVDTLTSNTRIHYSREALLAIRNSPLSQEMPYGLQIPEELRTDIFHREEDFLNSDSDSDNNYGIDFLNAKYDRRAGG